MSEREAKIVAKGYEEFKEPMTGNPPEWMDRVVIVGNVAYTSGCTGGRGKVPSEISLEDAKKACEAATVNVLRALRDAIGSLDNVERIIRVGGYVNADLDFKDPSLVIHGASELLYEVFGDAGRHCRTALGLATLPAGTATEVDMIVQIKV